VARRRQSPGTEFHPSGTNLRVNIYWGSVKFLLQQQPIYARMTPFLLNYLAACNLFVPAPLVKSTSVHVRVGDNEGDAVLFTILRKSISNAEKRGALAPSAPLAGTSQLHRSATYM
jgi:hypothetical protein